MILEGHEESITKNYFISMNSVEFKVQLAPLPWTPFKKENGRLDSEIAY